MFKKLLSMALCAIMVMGMGTTAFAAEASAANYTNGNEQQITSYYSGIEETEIMSADVLIIEYSELGNIIENAKNIIDSGILLYISNPECSAEEISNLLSVPKNSTTSYQSELLASYSIYKLDSNYVFSNNYIVFADEVITSEAAIENYITTPVTSEITAPNKLENSNFSNAITSTENKTRGAIPFIINHSELASASSVAKEDALISSSNISVETTGITPFSVTLPSTTATETWNDTLNVYGLNNTYYGYLNCTVYAYGLGRGTVNGSTQNVYDVISVTKAYPSANHYVKEFKTQIHCNFTDFSNLQTTSLPSGISYSDSVGLSGKIGSDGGSGGASYSTSWSYNPESQKITESSPSARVVNWVAKTVNPTKGKAYDIAPGMRILNFGSKIGQKPIVKGL